MTFLAGAGQSDTISVRLAQGLVVRLHTSGVGVEGVVVRAEALAPDSAHPAHVLLAPPTGSNFSLEFADTTNAAGEITLRIAFGEVVGGGRVVVSAPRYGVQDTAYFTVLEGNADHIRVAPRDTALYVGNAFQLRAFVADRAGNARNDPVTFQAIDTSTSVNASGQVTGFAIGRSAVRLVAATLGRADTVSVSVVPTGTIAARVGPFTPFPENAIVTMALDGSAAQVIPQSVGDNNYLQWTPDGSRLLMFRPVFEGHLYTMALSGNLQRVLPTSPFAEDNWARIAADGSYVYFRAARAYPGQGFIWRVRPDGTGLDSVPVPGGTLPAPSPDGARVAYVGSDSRVHVYDYGNGLDTDLGALGAFPRWSPDGNWLSYSSGPAGLITVLRPDGSGARVLGQANTFDGRFDWSPDSQWIVAVSGASILHLVHVPSGQVLPLAFTANLREVSWRP